MFNSIGLYVYLVSEFEPSTFVADQPFLYAIRSSSDDIFIGRYC